MELYLDIDSALYYLMDELKDTVQHSMLNVVYYHNPKSYTGYVYDELLVYSWGEHFRRCIKYSSSLKECLDVLKIPTALQEYIQEGFKKKCIECVTKSPYRRVFDYDGHFIRRDNRIVWCYDITPRYENCSANTFSTLDLLSSATY